MPNEDEIAQKLAALRRMLDVWYDMTRTFGPAKVLLTATLNDGSKLVLGETDRISAVDETDEFDQGC